MYYTKAQLDRIAKKVLKLAESFLINNKGATDNELIDYINKNIEFGDNLKELGNGVGTQNQVIYTTETVDTAIRVTKKQLSNDVKLLKVEGASIDVTVNTKEVGYVVESIEVDLVVICKILDRYNLEDTEIVYTQVGVVSVD